jgi:hypothetical protein
LNRERASPRTTAVRRIRVRSECMLFVIDANVWLKERLLRSAIGVAFVHAVKRLDARILLPSVTRDEIHAGVERMGLDAVAKVQTGFSTIQSLTGSCPDYKAPDAVAFRQATSERLEALSDILLPFDLELEHHQRALARVIGHHPPSAANREQYRDCLLWEALADVGDEGTCLVSADSDFVDKAAGPHQLAAELRRECREKVVLYRTLADALAAIEPALPPVDSEATRAAIAAEALTVAARFEESRGFRLGQVTGTDVKLFATEAPSRTAASFTVDFEAFDFPVSEGEIEPEVVVRLAGDCILRDDFSIEDVGMDSIFVFNQDGERLRGGVVYAKGGFGARQMMPYTVRSPIPGSPA